MLNALRRLSLLIILVAAGFRVSTQAAESGDCMAGSPSSPVKIEVFSDFQCPACRAFYMETISRIFPEYAETNQVCIAYREFPLSMHQHAKIAARYGHAAMRLGPQQWRVVSDAMFASQPEWANSGDIDPVIQKVLSPANWEALQKEMQDTAALDALIDADFNLGRERGVTSTPTFFVTANGKTEKIPTAVRYTILKRYLDSLLEK